METAKKEKVGTTPTSVRITPTCDRLWGMLAGQMGLSKAKYLEVVIREKAKEAGLNLAA